MLAQCLLPTNAARDPAACGTYQQPPTMLSRASVFVMLATSTGTAGRPARFMQVWSIDLSVAHGLRLTQRQEVFLYPGDQVSPPRCFVEPFELVEIEATGGDRMRARLTWYLEESELVPVMETVPVSRSGRCDTSRPSSLRPPQQRGESKTVNIEHAVALAFGNVPPSGNRPDAFAQARGDQRGRLSSSAFGLAALRIMRQRQSRADPFEYFLGASKSVDRSHRLRDPTLPDRSTLTGYQYHPTHHEDAMQTVPLPRSMHNTAYHTRVVEPGAPPPRDAVGRAARFVQTGRAQAHAVPSSAANYQAPSATAIVDAAMDAAGRMEPGLQDVASASRGASSDDAPPSVTLASSMLRINDFGYFGLSLISR